MIKNNKASLFAVIMFLCTSFLIYGCASVTQGRDFNSSLVQNIKKNVTTKTEIITMFGEPSQGKSFTAGNEVWSYIYNVTSATALGTVNSTGTKMLSVTFQDNVVTDFTYTEGAAPSVRPF